LRFFSAYTLLPICSIDWATSTPAEELSQLAAEELSQLQIPHIYIINFIEKLKVINGVTYQ